MNSDSTTTSTTFASWQDVTWMNSWIWHTHSPCSITEVPRTLDPVRTPNLRSLPTTTWQHQTRATLHQLSTTFTSWRDVTQMNCWSWLRTGMYGENLWSSRLTCSRPTYLTTVWVIISISGIHKHSSNNQLPLLFLLYLYHQLASGNEAVTSKTKIKSKNHVRYQHSSGQHFTSWQFFWHSIYICVNPQLSK